MDANENINPTLFLPALLSIGLVLLLAGVVWVSQVWPVVQAQQADLAAAETAASAAEQAAAGAQVSAGNAAHGETLFAGTCAACHGPQGQGIAGLGKDMTQSEFIAGQSDAELVEFIKVGRSPFDPVNTTGVDMPPKGGNPSLDEADLQDIVAFIRTLHQ